MCCTDSMLQWQPPCWHHRFEFLYRISQTRAWSVDELHSLYDNLTNLLSSESSIYLLRNCTRQCRHTSAASAKSWILRGSVTSSDMLIRLAIRRRLEPGSKCSHAWDIGHRIHTGIPSGPTRYKFKTIIISLVFKKSEARTWKQFVML
jgi:hypothetical protein